MINDRKLEQADDGVVVTFLLNGTCSKGTDYNNAIYSNGETISVLRQNIRGINLSNYVNPEKHTLDNLPEKFSHAFMGADGPGSGNLDHHQRLVDPGNHSEAAQIALGAGINEEIEHFIVVLKEMLRNGKKIKIVNLGGWSRGAAACISLASRMSQEKELKDIAVNIFGIDPVPGIGNTHDGNRRLTTNVKHAFFVYAGHEKSGCFAAVIPEAVDPKQTTIRCSIVPGHHATMVGNPSWRCPATADKYPNFKPNFKEPGELIRWMLEQFLTIHGSQLENKLEFTPEALTERFKQIKRDLKKGHYEILAEEAYIFRQLLGHSRKITYGNNYWFNVGYSQVEVLHSERNRLDKCVNSFHAFLKQHKDIDPSAFFRPDYEEKFPREILLAFSMSEYLDKGQDDEEQQVKMLIEERDENLLDSSNTNQVEQLAPLIQALMCNEAGKEEIPKLPSIPLTNELADNTKPAAISAKLDEEHEKQEGLEEQPAPVVEQPVPVVEQPVPAVEQPAPEEIRPVFVPAPKISAFKSWWKQMTDIYDITFYTEEYNQSRFLAFLGFKKDNNLALDIVSYLATLQFISIPKNIVKFFSEYLLYVLEENVRIVFDWSLEKFNQTNTAGKVGLFPALILLGGLYGLFRGLRLLTRTVTSPIASFKAAWETDPLLGIVSAITTVVATTAVIILLLPIIAAGVTVAGAYFGATKAGSAILAAAAKIGAPIIAKLSLPAVLTLGKLTLDTAFTFGAGIMGIAYGASILLKKFAGRIIQTCQPRALKQAAHYHSKKPNNPDKKMFPNSSFSLLRCLKNDPYIPPNLILPNEAPRNVPVADAVEKASGGCCGLFSFFSPCASDGQQSKRAEGSNLVRRHSQK